MPQILTRISLLTLSAVAIFLLALHPAFGQQERQWGAEVLPGEEKHWYARHVTKSYRDARTANDDIAKLRAMGINNAHARLRPWYWSDKSTLDSELVIGPFATKQEAEDVQIDIYRRTKELYQTMHMPWTLHQNLKAEVYLVSVGAYASKEDTRQAVHRLIDIGFSPEAMGFFSNDGMFYWRAVASGYKLKSNAERVARRLQSNGFNDATVLYINWDVIGKLENNRVAYQKAKATQGSRSGDGAYGYDYKYQQWKSCVERHSNEPWSSMQVGSSYFKCGNAPTP